MGKAKKEFQYQIKGKAEEISPLLKEIFSEIEKELANYLEVEFSLELAAREMLANAIEHGKSLALKQGKKESEIVIEISLKILADRIKFIVKDPGPGFNWQDHDYCSMPELEEKGRGLKMVNKVADKIEFNQKGNEITASFKI